MSLINVSELSQTYTAIWNDWFPESGRKPAEAPILERPNATFDPRAGRPCGFLSRTEHATMPEGRCSGGSPIGQGKHER